MRKLVVGILMVLVLTIGGLLLASSFFPKVNAQESQFKAHSLLNASIAEVQKAAMDYTQSRFQILATPEIVLTRSITKEEIPDLGLSKINFGGQTPPLALVALKGDFEVRLRGMLKPTRAKFLFYIIDLNVGAPTLIEYSNSEEGYEQLFAEASKFSTTDNNQRISPEGESFRPSPIQTAIPVTLPELPSPTQ